MTDDIHFTFIRFHISQDRSYACQPHFRGNRELYSGGARLQEGPGQLHRYKSRAPAFMATSRVFAASGCCAGVVAGCTDHAVCCNTLSQTSISAIGSPSCHGEPVSETGRNIAKGSSPAVIPGSEASFPLQSGQSFQACFLSAHKSSLSETLPPELQQRSDVTAFDELFNTYETTTGSAHNTKYPGSLFSQPSHPLPPPHWKVHYNKDLWDKLKLRAWRAAQKPGSEMKAEFQECPAQPTYSTFHAGPQPFPLDNHLTHGPSQVIVATTENKAVSGAPYYIRDKGVLHLNDMYASTTMRDFHAFTQKELQGYPKKDVLTYWQAEDYPKVWGHGLKENPIAKETKPPLRRPPPMRDSLQFPDPTKLPRIPPRARSVPHCGFKTLAQESYRWPLDAKRSYDVYFPLECPWSMARTGALPEIMAVPKMYRTEYEAYGSKRQALV